MAAAAYRHLSRQLELPDLLVQADQVRETMATPGWEILAAAIGEHESRMMKRLLHETTHAEDIPWLRGLVQGLRSMQEAADSLISHAEEREAEARRKTAQETANA